MHKPLTRTTLLLVCALLAAIPTPAARKKVDQTLLEASTFKGLELRSLGPALVSGRIADIAIDPSDHARWFVAAASGGVWYTADTGITWTPVFDGEGSYSIGCVTLDPNDPLTVWVGTGENNSQRSVGYGDGVYKSVDGGKSWKNVGLETSEHIGRIVVDPRDSNVVFVAAQGPLWKDGGDRGLYKTTDGGKSWNKVLEIDEHTGVTDVILDPRNPDRMLAASYQRRRHVWTLINGGPGSAIHRSTDGGETWSKVDSGLPEVDLGRIGLAVSPADPDIVYAIVEAAQDEGGVFRSADGGTNWEKRSDYMSGSGQYYNELIADPLDPDRVYSMDTWMHVTEDGGKTWTKVPETYKHVDNHALWIDPADTDHLVAGCDGGVYETWDRGANWEFKANLPVTQFYKATPDNDFPFYNVYGGTQDNATLGGPSRTTHQYGIANHDWYVTIFGDGFKTQIDPEDPNIVYSQYQYGGLARYDRRSGQLVDIQPQPAPGEDALRFNWDSALIVSPHLHTRLYFAAQRVFRSDDRGNSWQAVSPDLTRGIDRNSLEVMGKVWSVDAVAKNASTSFYGNIVSLAESPLREGLIYAGTDDGVVAVTEDGGQSWRRIESFPGIPELAYVNDIEASQHDPDTVFVAFNNHKSGDFAPYLLESADRGRSWSSIRGDLPERGSTYALAQDHEKPGLMFVGTESGIFFTVDGGKKWVRLEGGMPTIAVRDVEIQRRENDLVLGTFGRGFYVLDDYTPLREVDEAALAEEARLFPVKKTWMYIEDFPMGIRGKAFQGDAFYTAPNPPYGAVVTYYLKEEIKTLAEQRRERESRLEEKGDPIPYPDWDALRAEDREKEPAIVLTVRDADGAVVRRIEGPVEAGFHRVAWDLRYPPSEPVSLSTDPLAPWEEPERGPLALPGSYTVEMARRTGGMSTPLGQPQRFETVPLGRASLPAENPAELLSFQRKVARLQRAVLGSVRAASEAQTRIDHLEAALGLTPAAPPTMLERLHGIEARLEDLQVVLSGDRTVSGRNEPTPPSIVDRVQRIVYGQWLATAGPTRTNLDAYRYASEAFGPVLEKLTGLIETDLAGLESESERVGAPWTPGRVPRWTPE